MLAFGQQSPPAKATAAESHSAGLPLNFERQTGDLDAMVKRGSIRALVLYSRSGFFYVDGKPEGIYYQALQYFEQFLNQKLHTRQHVQVTYIPVRPDQLEAALTEGVGDLIAYGLVVTPEREQQVAFSRSDTDRRETDHRHAKRLRAAVVVGGAWRKESLR